MSLTNRGHARLPAVNRISSRGPGKRVAVLAAGIAAVPLLAGCFNGFAAQTSNQPPSGDGLSTEVGDMQVRSAVWVRSPQNPAAFTLSATFVNTGQTPDVLTSVTTTTKGTVDITGGTIPLAKKSEQRTAYNSNVYVNLTGSIVPPSNYIVTTFNFAKAGSVTGSVLVVPSEGIYAGISPNGTGGSAAPTASASATPTSTASATATPSAKPSVTATTR